MIWTLSSSGKLYLPMCRVTVLTSENRFDFADIGQGGNSGFVAQNEVATQLHNILKPFLLRRLKVEVERGLPPKKEYLLYAPLTQQQSDIYKAIVNREIKDHLIKMKLAACGADPAGTPQMIESSAPSDDEGVVRTSRRLSKRPRFDYSLDTSDAKFLQALSDGDADGMSMTAPKEEKTAQELGQEWAEKQASEFKTVKVV
jgi:ATP-dependent DNA helicase